MLDFTEVVALTGTVEAVDHVAEVVHDKRPHFDIPLGGFKKNQ